MPLTVLLDFPRFPIDDNFLDVLVHFLVAATFERFRGRCQFRYFVKQTVVFLFFLKLLKRGL